jgi:thiol:disulfide interchange protein DsbA
LRQGSTARRKPGAGARGGAGGNDGRGATRRRRSREARGRRQRRRDGGRGRERDEPDRRGGRGNDACAAGGQYRALEGRPELHCLSRCTARHDAAGKVEVVEGFWYGCGHCFALEPRLESWEKSKPDWIVLKRTPVIWNEVTREDARLYFTIESLGLLDKLHAEVFRQIHVNKQPFTVIRQNAVDKAATEKAAREFLTARGVSEDQFAKVYRSFSTENKLRQAENLSRRYLLDHTPMFVVHGKYLTDAENGRRHRPAVPVVNDLAAREHEAT